jgi:putative ABC transport system permease protein
MGMDETVFLPAPVVWEIAERSHEVAEQPLNIPDGHISTVLVALSDPAQAAAVAAQIETQLPDVSVLTAGEIAGTVSDNLSGLMATLTPITVGVLLVALVLFLILFVAIAQERSREIGLLRALGATANQAIFALVLEAAFLGALGGAAGVLGGGAVYALFKEAITVSYTLPFLFPKAGEQTQLAAVVILAAAVGGALSAAYPAWRLTRLDPHHAIHSR